MRRGQGVGSRAVRRLPCLLVAAGSVLLAACSSAATPGPASPTSQGTVSPARLTVYAAASLKAAMASVKETYEAARPGASLSFSVDSSAALATKIEQGAPADVFLSADMANPERLAAAGLASTGVVRFAGNLLTVIVPADNPSGIRTPADLAKPGIKIIACGDSVPIQRYATQLVANLATEPGYPADYARAYGANIVSREDNVAALVAKIALGEGDAGIVYATDARGSSKVTAIPVPGAANVPAAYGALVVKASPNQAAGAAFLAWLTSPAGQAILATFGFQSPPAVGLAAA
jgi:molybdate transport system substrate-binding protein